MGHIGVPYDSDYIINKEGGEGGGGGGGGRSEKTESHI